MKTVVRNRVSALFCIASYFAAVLVIAIHANALHWTACPEAWNVLLHKSICEVLNVWAVPFFFAASGFWFSLGKYAMRGGYREFMVHKAKSLLVPYVLWSLVATVVAQPLVAYSNFVAQRPLLDRSALALYDHPLEFVNAVFGVFEMGPMHDGALWYVRHLLILFCFAPLLRIFSRRSFAWIGIVAWFVIAIAPEIEVVPYLSLRINSLSYFLLGMGVAVYFPQRLLATRQQDAVTIPKCFTSTFWLYCAHVVLLPYVQQLLLALFGKGNVGTALTTFFSIVSVVCCTTWFGSVMEKRFPTCYAMLTGGRK